MVNGSCVRVLRTIAGQPKYSRWTGAKVRVCLIMPENLCYISQNRLCHLAQLTKRRADTLLSLLIASSSWSNRICCSSGQIDTTCFSRLTTRLKMRRTGQIASRVFHISGSGRCAAGFERRELWMKMRRKVEANAKPKTSTCSSA